MNTALLSLSLLTLLSASNAHAILHGEASSAYPAVVKLEVSGIVRDDDRTLRPDSYLCAGTKISANLIMTAAHCVCPVVVKRSDPLMRTFFGIPANDPQYYVKVNDQKLDAPEVGFAPGSFGNHCRNPLLRTGLFNDIAFIKVNAVDAAKLPAETLAVDFTPVVAGDAVEVVGYGTTQVTLSNEKGQQPSYDVYGSKTLGRNVVKAFDRNEIEVQGPLVARNRRSVLAEQATILPGDSGSPLIRNGKVVGIGCAQVWEKLDQNPKNILNRTYSAAASSEFFKESLESALAKAGTSAAE